MPYPTVRGALTACVLLSLFDTAALAATSPGADELSEIVITATRVKQPTDRALEPIVVIDRAELEASAALDVGDVLRYHAGLDLGRYGGPGQPLSLFIRGANSNQSIVMIDGVRINAGTQSLAPLSNLAPELFERVEIVKGPRSAIYGTDAIGGVVNFITRQGAPSGAELMLGYGRYGTGEFAADGNYRQGETSLQAALAGQQSAGFPTFAGDWQNSGYKNLSGTVAAATRVGGIELGARYWQASGDTQYANQVYNSNPPYQLTGYAQASEHFQNSALAAHAGGDLTDLWHAQATVSRVRDDLRQQQVVDYDYTSRDTLDLQNDVRWYGSGLHQLFTFGAILTAEQTHSSTYGTVYAVDTHTQTYYLQDQIEAGANRLLLALGEYHHPAFGDHATWNAEYGYALTPGLLLIASTGTAFRAPSATDRFGYGGNPDLLPESSRNYELGVKARLGEHQEVTFAAFQNTIDDLVVFVNDPNNVVYGGENQNVDRARIRGLEASWLLHSGPWAVRAEGSLQDPRDLGKDSELLRRAKRSFTFSTTRSFGRAELGLDLLESGPRADIDANTFGPAVNGGYLLLAIRGKLQLTPAWSVSARLDNALDRDYQLVNGYNTAARSASIATRYSFR